MFRVFLIASLIIFLTFDIFSQQVETLTEPFNGSGGIAVDKSGVLYVGNFGSGFGSSDGNNLFKVYSDGTVEEFATGFNGASGNAVDSDGNVYQANINNNTVSKVSSTGEVTQFANSKLYYPVGVAVDSKSNVYVSNCGVDPTGKSTITKITPDGTTSKFASSTAFDCPNGLTVDENDNLYTCNYNNGKVFKINTDGSVELIATLPDNNNSHLVYANNSLYVAKRCANKIYRVLLDGTYYLIAGTGIRGNDDGDPLSATINLPNGVSVSPDGDTLYFTSKTSFNGACFDTDLNPVLVRMITGLKSITGVNDMGEIPTKLKLEQNYPNPFNPTTKISFSLPSPSQGDGSGVRSTKVTLKVYDVLGNEIATLVNEEKSAGNYEVEFDGSNLSSGVYYYQIRTGSFIDTKKFVLLK